MIMNTTKSTSQRQGRLREEGFEGSRRANVRAKPAPDLIRETETAYKAPPLGELAQHNKARRFERQGCGLGFTIRLRPDDFREPPIADPHDVWCGEGRLITVPYPISRFKRFYP